MAKIFAAVIICVVFAATTLSFPSIDDGNHKFTAKKEKTQVMVATSQDGRPLFAVNGMTEEKARLGNIQSLLNFTAYIQGAPINQTAINFVPLLTVLTGLGK